MQGSSKQPEFPHKSKLHVCGSNRDRWAEGARVGEGCATEAWEIADWVNPSPTTAGRDAVRARWCNRRAVTGRHESTAAHCDDFSPFVHVDEYGTMIDRSYFFFESLKYYTSMNTSVTRNQPTCWLFLMQDAWLVIGLSAPRMQAYGAPTSAGREGEVSRGQSTHIQ